MTLHLVDGSGYIFRAYYALPPLSTPEGVPAGAVYGFTNMLLRLMESVKDDRLLVVFDAGRQNFRHNLYPDYKANRASPPEDLIPQFSLIREACNALGVPCLEIPGFEADDIIATMSVRASAENQKTRIISGDKDLMQLLNQQVEMFDPVKNKPVDAEVIFNKFGVTADKVIEVQALCGDSSDNIPGVPGIGPKTAAELIHTFGDVETLLAKAATEIKQPKRRQSLIDNRELALISKQLVTLKTDVPLPYGISSIPDVKTDFTQLHSFLDRMGFKSLSKRLQQKGMGGHEPLLSATQQVVKQQIESICITDEATLKKWLLDVEKTGLLVIDVETTGLNTRTADLVGISLGVKLNTLWQGAYIPVGHKTESQQLPLALVKTHLKKLLLNHQITKIGHNLKFDMAILERYGLPIKSLQDTMLLSYCLYAGLHGHSMDELSERYLNYKPIGFKEVAGIGKKQVTFDEVDLEKATQYAGEDAVITGKLYDFLQPQLVEKQVNQIYYTVERPLIPVIQSMEKIGVKVDRESLENIGKSFLAQITDLENEIIGLAGEEFNVASPKQLGEILFDKLGLPKPKKTKTGTYATDTKVLEDLANQGYAIADKLIAWRGLSKLYSTYVEGLLEAQDSITQRVHTCYSMVGAATGRLSSSDPNLQNIPVRTNDGQKIRKAFIADQGYTLYSLDYSQIELRLLAHFADVPTLQQAFVDGQDIHKITAMEVFHKTEREMTQELRRQAKAINFGIIYGISNFGLAKQLQCSNGEAQDIIRHYFEKYPGIQAYMEAYKEYASHHGYVKTLFNRRVHLPFIKDRNYNLRNFAERQAINAPLQGSNADIIKVAMAKVFDFLKDKKTRMLLQVHDELIFEVPEEEITTVPQQLQTIMQGITQLKVPLKVDIGCGPNWHAAH